MVLYIDCVNRKAYVTELQRSNKAGEDETNADINKEVDIDNVETLFDNEFFD